MLNSETTLPDTVQVIQTKQKDPRLIGYIPPLEKALLPDNAALFPGSRRLYRQGVHEGADFFDRYQPQTGGKFVAYGSPVRAIKAGLVTRTDHEFKELTSTEHQQMLAACRRQHETTRTQEDRFRGRQVWIEHEGGVTSIYAHLSSIPSNLKPGVQLKQGELIGHVGNSGTSNAVAGNRLNPHLHLEIWLNEPDDPIKGEYAGKWLSFAETRELWTSLLSGSSE